MFPLGTVLLPWQALPLHVFEPRYLEMIRRCLSGEPEFGVTLIERGSEVGGGDVRAAVGCVARIVDVKAFPDGRLAVVAVGTRRIEVIQWLLDDPYPQAVVCELDDDLDEPPESDVAQRHQHNVVLLRRCLALMAELGERAPPATAEFAPDPVQATYQLATLAPIGPADRYRILCAPDASTRCGVLHDMLADARAVLELRMAEGA
jgi:uncharacterized protein